MTSISASGLRWLTTAACALLAGCGGSQSSLNPRGPEAEALSEVITIFTLTCAAIWLLVTIALIVALWRARRARRAPAPNPLAVDEGVERRAAYTVGGSVLATILILVALGAISYGTDRQPAIESQQSMYKAESAPDADKATMSVIVDTFRWICGTRG